MVTLNLFETILNCSNISGRKRAAAHNTCVLVHNREAKKKKTRKLR